MPPLKRFAAGIAVAALVAGGAACTKDDPVAQPTPPPPTTSAAPSPSPSATPTPTPTPTLSQRQQAEADAIAMVKKYYALSDKLAAKPPGIAAAKRQLQAVASGKELSVSVFTLNNLRSANRHTRGSVTFDHVRQEGIDLTTVTKSKTKHNPSVKLRLCLDVSQFHLIDANGEPVSLPGRQLRRISHLELMNANWPDRSGWRVDHIVDETTKC